MVPEHSGAAVNGQSLLPGGAARPILGPLGILVMVTGGLARERDVTYGFTTTQYTIEDFLPRSVPRVGALSFTAAPIQASRSALRWTELRERVSPVFGCGGRRKILRKTRERRHTRASCNPRIRYGHRSVSGPRREGAVLDDDIAN